MPAAESADQQQLPPGSIDAPSTNAAMPLPLGFVPPCLPTKAQNPPTGEAWLHEIKHDGFRVIARKHGGRVRLYSCLGNDLTHRFPLIVEALARISHTNFA